MYELRGYAKRAPVLSDSAYSASPTILNRGCLNIGSSFVLRPLLERIWERGVTMSGRGSEQLFLAGRTDIEIGVGRRFCSLS